MTFYSFLREIGRDNKDGRVTWEAVLDEKDMQKDSSGQKREVKVH